MKAEIILVTVILLLVFSCEKDDDGNDYFDLSKESEFQINKDYFSNNQQFKFSIAEISDSRCPTGVYCFWQGMVTVTIAIEKPRTDTITLNSHDQLIGNCNNYKFELGEVIPYPDINKEIEKEDYVVWLKITKHY